MITRDDFMAFFRDNEQLNTLSNDDRVEVFCTILAGSSDFTKDLLDEVLDNYSVLNIEIKEIANSSLVNK